MSAIPRDREDTVLSEGIAVGKDHAELMQQEIIHHMNNNSSVLLGPGRDKVVARGISNYYAVRASHGELGFVRPTKS